MVGVLRQTGEVVLVGTTEMEDALVGIPGDEDAGPRRGEHLEETGGRGVEVVGVIDEQQFHGVALPVEDAAAFGGVLQFIEDTVQQLGDVECVGAGELHDAAALTQEIPGADPHVQVVFASEVGECVGSDTPLLGTQQQVAELAGEADEWQGRSDALGPGPGAVHGVALQQRADEQVVVGTGHQPGQGFLAQLCDGAQQGEGPRVHGTDRGPGGRVAGRVGGSCAVDVAGKVAQQVGEPAAQLRRRLLRGSDHHDPGRVSPVAQVGHQGIEQQRSLSGSRSSEHGVGPVTRSPVVVGDQGVGQTAPLPRRRAHRSDRCGTGVSTMSGVEAYPDAVGRADPSAQAGVGAGVLAGLCSTLLLRVGVSPVRPVCPVHHGCSPSPARLSRRPRDRH